MCLLAVFVQPACLGKCVECLNPTGGREWNRSRNGMRAATFEGAAKGFPGAGAVKASVMNQQQHVYEVAYTGVFAFAPVWCTIQFLQWLADQKDETVAQVNGCGFLDLSLIHI